MGKKRGTPSSSFVPEETAPAVADYYNSLSDEEAAELSHWGQFALREFRKQGADLVASPVRAGAQHAHDLRSARPVRGRGCKRLENGH